MPVDLLARQPRNLLGNNQEEAPSSNYFKDVGNTSLNMILGFGKGLVDIPIAAGNLANEGLRKVGIPVGNVPLNPPKPEGTGSGTGQFLGNVAGYALGGEALGAGLGAAKALPYIGKGAQLLGSASPEAGAARGILGGAAYGALENPENRMGGAALGALYGVGGEALPYAIKGFSAVKPGRAVASLAEYLSPKNVSKLTKEGNNLYADLFNSVGDRSLISAGGQVIKPGVSSVKNTEFFKALEKEEPEIVNRAFNQKIKDYQDILERKPTIGNANELQSLIRKRKDELSPNSKNPFLGLVNANELRVLNNAHSAIKDDIRKFFESSHPDQYKKYLEANINWAKVVKPQQEALKTLYKSSVYDPVKKQRLFKNPQKVVNTFQKYSNEKTILPQKVLDHLEKIENKIQNRKIAEMGIGLLAGTALGHYIPMVGALGEFAGAGIGALLGNRMFRGLKAPSRKIPEKIMDLTITKPHSLYNLGKGGTISTFLSNNEENQ